MKMTKPMATRTELRTMAKLVRETVDKKESYDPLVEKDMMDVLMRVANALGLDAEEVSFTHYLEGTPNNALQIFEDDEEAFRSIFTMCLTARHSSQRKENSSGHEEKLTQKSPKNIRALLLYLYDKKFELIEE